MRGINSISLYYKENRWWIASGLLKMKLMGQYQKNIYQIITDEKKIKNYNRSL
ncbi:MAG: hypothetical protein Ct9H300mP4_17670 [Gammaproteobacteria bacterium]|nr:MAG: hypothetical protein Ct9H300mP4_17670 [Gammaproteobacteria bacterium]